MQNYDTNYKSCNNVLKHVNYRRYITCDNPLKALIDNKQQLLVTIDSIVLRPRMEAMTGSIMCLLLWAHHLHKCSWMQASLTSVYPKPLMKRQGLRYHTTLANKCLVSFQSGNDLWPKLVMSVAQNKLESLKVATQQNYDPASEWLMRENLIL